MTVSHNYGTEYSCSSLSLKALFYIKLDIHDYYLFTDYGW